MAYATPTELALYSLAPGVAGTFTTDEKQAALDAASDLIDSYIGGRFDLPLTPPFSLDLVAGATDIAAYMLMKRRGFSPGGEDARQFESAYERVISWLKDVSTGRAVPGGHGPKAIDAGGPTGVLAQSAPFVIGGARGPYGRAGSFWEPEDECSVPPYGTPRRRGW